MGDKVSSTLISGVVKQNGTTQDGLTVVAYRKTTHPKKDEPQGWETADVNDCLNVFDNSETRTPTLVIENHGQDSR